MKDRLLTYEDTRREVEENTQERLKRIEKYAELFPIATEIAETFCQDPRIGIWRSDGKRAVDMVYADSSSTINCLSVDLLLGEDDSVMTISPIIDDLKQDERFHYVGRSDFIEVGWIGYVFKYKPTDVKFMVRIWFENSKRCKKIDTGRTEKVYEFKCEEAVPE